MKSKCGFQFVIKKKKKPYFYNDEPREELGKKEISSNRSCTMLHFKSSFYIL